MTSFYTAETTTRTSKMAFRTLIILFISFCFSNFSKAQCPYSGATDFCPDLDASTFAVGVSNVVCGSTWGTEHAQVNNMDANCTYLIEYCGAPFDAAIGVFTDGGGMQVAYSGTGCGDDVSFSFTPPSNGNYEFQLDNEGACNTVAANNDLVVTLVSCVSSCTDPDVPNVSASLGTICPSGSSTLSWTGSLNDATAWHVYSGSCGGTLVGTTTGSSIVVNPTSTTSYFVRGEGGCVTPGSCSSGTTVTVTDVSPPVITVCAPTPPNISANSFCQATCPDLTGLVTATDNCTASPTITQSPAAGATLGLGTTTITLTATDGSGNMTTCTVNQTVVDNTSPVITVCAPTPPNISANSFCQATCPDLTGLVTATDNCTASPTITQSPAAGATLGLGTTTITLTATDGSGNMATCTVNQTVVDNTVPTAVCQNVTVFLDGTGTANITAGDIDNGSSDNCGGVSLSAAPSSFTCANLGANNVTLTVTDGNGNTNTCIAVVTVLDTISPTISCPGNQTENPNASCQFVLPNYISTLSITGSDNCGTPTISMSPLAGTTITGTTMITISATDVSGNASTCTFDVVLNDVTNPTAVCQNITVFLDGSGNASITAADIDGGSTDNCVGLSLSASQTTFNCSDIGANNVTLTATDGNGNTNSCMATVTVQDTISPMASCQNVTVYLDGTGNASITAADLDNGSMDNCGSVSLSASQTTFDCTNTGANNVTLTVTDGSGNTGTCSAVVTVLDTISPSLMSCPGNINIVTNNAGCEGIAIWTSPTIMDNCSGGSVSGTHTSGSSFPLGTTTVNYTATDASGNTSSCSFDVIVTSDLSVATDSVHNALCFDSLNGQAFITVTGGTMGYTYDWDHDGTSDNDDSEDQDGLGAGTYNVTVTDVNGCTATGTATIGEPAELSIALDGTTDPTTCGANDGAIMVTTTGGTGAYVFDWDNDGTGDNDDTEDLSGVTAGGYQLTVTDANGCTATTSQTLSDPAAPMVSFTAPADICANETILTGLGNGTPTGGVYSGTGVTDDGNGTSYSFDPTTAGVGVHTITYTYTDGSGCVGAASDDVEVFAVPVISSSSVTNISCSGAGDGSISVTTSGSGLSYDWDIDGTGDFNDPQSVAGLDSGTYVLQLMNADGCMVSQTFNVTEPAALALSATSTDELLGSDGTIDLTVSGGIPNYTYDWDNDGTGDNDDTQDLNGLTPGSYTVIVYDDNGCSDTLTVDVGTQVGVSTLEAIDFKVYPNPTYDNITLESNKSLPYTVTLLDNTGRLISSENVSTSNYQIDLSGLSKGIYLLKVDDQAVRVVKR